MFDIGFWELALIGVVALLVVGPERLPKLARTTGLWVRKVRRFVGGVRADIEEELRTEELKSLLDEGRQLKDVGQTLEQTRATFAEARRDLSASVNEGQSSPEPPPEASAAQATNGPVRPPGHVAPSPREPKSQKGASADTTPISAAETHGDPDRKHGG